MMMPRIKDVIDLKKSATKRFNDESRLEMKEKRKKEIWTLGKLTKKSVVKIY